MEVRQLRYFIAVADTLNFSRAAETLYISQSALSRQIMELEKEIGVPLFTRSTRQVRLTDAGRALQESAKDLISRWEKIVPEVRHQSHEALHTVSLTIGVDARALEQPQRRIRVMEILYGLRENYHPLRIMLRSCTYQEILSGLIENSLDCGLILDREMEPRAGIAAETFGSEEMVLAFRSSAHYAASDYADIIRRRGLILVDKEPQGLYHIIRILSDLGLDPQIRFCETLQDMTMTVETGESAMILPESVAARLDNPNLQILRLPTLFAKLSIALLWPEGADNPVVETLRERLRIILSA